MPSMRVRLEQLSTGTLANLLPIPKRVLSPQLGALLHRSAWGIGDQALVSAASFAMLILIARAVTPAQFGLFSIAMSFIYIEVTLIGSLLNQPFTVISAAREGEAYKSYVMSVLLAQVVCGFLVVLIVLLFAGIAATLGWHSWSLAMVLGPAVFSWQIQEFVRVVLYAEDRLRTALFNDLLAYGGQLLIIIYATERGLLTPSAALLIITAMTGLAAVVGLVLIRKSLTLSLTSASFIANNTENWKFSRWTLGSSVLTMSSTHTLPFVLGAFSGPTAAGIMRVMAATMGPTHVLLRSINGSFGPTAARVYAGEGSIGLRALVKRMFLVIIPPMAAYCVIAAGFARPLLGLLYGDAYIDYDWLLGITALSYFIVSVYTPIEIALRAIRATSVLFRASLWNFLGVWILGAPAVYFLGLEGVSILIAVNVIVALELWQRYSREIRQCSMLPAST
jgi:O-antigen/teichoic acid export membrane protein